MKLKAIDTLHVSAVGPDNIAPGAEFEVSDDMARQLIVRGLAVEVKVAAPVANKMEPAPSNKGAEKRKAR